MLADVLSVVLRALSFVLLFQAAGAAIFVAAFGRRLVASRSLVASVGAASGLAAVVFVAGHYLLEAARMAGELGGTLNGSLQSRVLHSSIGAMAMLRILGLLLVWFGLRGDNDGRRVTSAVGATLAVASFALVGHVAMNPERWLLVATLVAHLLIVAYWFGALVPLYLIASREATAVAGTIIEAFSRVAGWLVPGILVAGLVLAIVLVPGWQMFREAYGQLLIAKFVGFALLMLFAALNKWRLGPAIARGDARAVGRFRHSVAIEFVLIVAVLATTAVMTSFFSPE